MMKPWQETDVLGRVDIVGDCWIWRGSKTNGGYGTCRGTTAHRVVYEALVGPIPAGYQVDHVKARGCTSVACVNPAHLEALTPRENLMRGDTVTAAKAAQTHCIRGHVFDEANTRRRKSNGVRQCRACDREAYHRRKAQQVAA